MGGDLLRELEGERPAGKCPDCRERLRRKGAPPRSDPATRTLYRRWREGERAFPGYLEDHAFLLEALLTLYEATFEPRWFGEARTLADTMIDCVVAPLDQA